MKSFDKLQLINNLVLKNAPLIKDIGLMNGKTGISIYLFHFSKIMDERIYKEHAETLIEDVYQEVENNMVPPDFGNGLAGIVWGIDHLERNGFLEANPDEIFADPDDRIFRFITNQSEISLELERGLLGYGFYLLARLRGKDLENVKGRDYLLKRLLIDIINQIYELIEEKEHMLLEPAAFKLTWVLPLTLIFLAEVMYLNVYRRKISRILDRLSYVVLSSIPIRHSYRLYLATGMEMVLKYEDLPRWKEHLHVLKSNFDPDKLLSEFPDKSLTLTEGLSGICPIIRVSNNICNKNRLLNQISDKINKSLFWNELKTRERFMSSHMGLSKGISGIGHAFVVFQEVSSQ
ncbi:MAG: hypothetical protein MI975_20410 [Cytophagales bacterium]|nr:hypothetical protein [Cytophagales bacterium]